MDIVCTSCKKTFKANPLELASATVNFNLGRPHTFKCDHCKADNKLTKTEFEALKKGKPVVAASASVARPVAAAKPVAKPVAAAKPVAKPVAAAKPVARPMPAREVPESAKPAAPMAAAQREGTVLVASLHVRKDHSTTSETVAGLVKGNKVKVLATWTDGKNTWAQIGPDQWAAVEHNGKKMIELA
ncbi:MAG: hypothetical protein HFACDABA_01612 [Anaerolineales bacterium]|nr:hypothetical protein [Anaerolineales bacterium]